jgi:hypothetical protein
MSTASKSGGGCVYAFGEKSRHEYGRVVYVVVSSGPGSS